MKKNGRMEVLHGLAYLTQVGLSAATPPVLCLLGAWWLSSRCGWGTWVYILAIVLGIGAGACSLWDYFRLVQRKLGRTQTPPPKSEDVSGRPKE